MKKIIFGTLLSLFLSGCIASDTSWYFKQMKVHQLQQISQVENQTIAIIDSGISNYLLNKYEDHIIATYNVIDDNDKVKDTHGHGSEMAALVLDETRGLAPEAKIIVIKIIDDDGLTTNELLLKGLDKARQLGATIINLSLGGYKQDQAVRNKIHELIEEHITILAASGDFKDKDLLFPANVEGVISVGALDKQHCLWAQCNFDESLICAFPGVDIVIDDTILDGDVETVLLGESENHIIKKSGTSEATIIASCYVARLRSFYERNQLEYDNQTLINDLQSLDTLSKKKVDYLKPFK